jgi:hypothetical protein
MSFQSRRLPSLTAALAGSLLLSVVGCLTHTLVRPPIEQTEMVKQILAIAPIGTPRDEAVRRLKAAGIRGDFEMTKSYAGEYFACQSWQRKNGDEWKLSLLLHFDKSGKLYETLELPDLYADGDKAARRG